MHYTSPLGAVYKKDPIIKKWTKVPEQYVAVGDRAVSECISPNYLFSYRMDDILPTIALSGDSSISVLGPITCTEASMYIIGLLAENESYVPGHRLIRCLNKKVLIEQEAALPTLSIRSNTSTHSTKRTKASYSTKEEETQRYEIARRLYDIQNRTGDIQYVYEQIVLYDIHKYFSPLGLSVIEKHIVSKEEEHRLRAHIKKYPMTMYCKTNRYNRSPIDISKLDHPSEEIRHYLSSTPVYKSLFRDTPPIHELFHRTRGPSCIVDLPMPVIESIFSKERQARRHEIVSTIESYAKDIGTNREIDRFYHRLFKETGSMQYEGILLGIQYEDEYARIQQAHKDASSSETEEGEIKR